MGRPLAKRFFGNENSNDSGDNRSTWGTVANGGTAAKPGEGIAGDGVASVTINTVGSYTSALPTVAFSAPNLAGIGGVTATGTVHGKALSAVVSNAGTGYQIGDILVQHNGATGTYATWRVTKLRVLTATLSDAANSQAFDGGENLVWDSGVNSHWTTATILTNVSSTGAPNYDISGWASFTGGVWDGTDGTLAPTTALTITGGNNTPNPTNPSYNTRGAGDLSGGTGDNNGNGGKVTFTYGIEQLTLVTEGDYTAITSGAKALDYTTGSGGSSATATITYGVKAVEITDPGSGYTTVVDAAPTFSAGVAAGTSVLTVDNGTPYAADGFNTIIVYAQTTDLGSNLVGDIIKQENTQRYKVKTADGTAYCNLVTHTPNAKGQVMMKATDSNNATYYVMKLNSRKVTIYPYGGGTHLFPLQGANSDQPQQVHWTFTTGDTTYDSATTVIIENA